MFLQLDLRFRAPARPGDVITGAVDDVHVTRDDGVVAVDGTAVCYTEPLG